MAYDALIEARKIAEQKCATLRNVLAERGDKQLHRVKRVRFYHRREIDEEGSAPIFASLLYG